MNCADVLRGRVCVLGMWEARNSKGAADDAECEELSSTFVRGGDEIGGWPKSERTCERRAE